MVRYRWGGVVEWYRNGPFGLEHGFTLARRPPGGAGPFTLELSVGGSLRARRSGARVVFVSSRGAVLARDDELNLHDASGRPLAAALELSGGHLLVRVWDQGAHYPLSVNQFIQVGQKLTGTGETSESGLSLGEFGTSVALSADGNTALIGGPEDNNGVGAAWLFTRSR
jgi:hypothetical protein